MSELIEILESIKQENSNDWVVNGVRMSPVKSKRYDPGKFLGMTKSYMWNVDMTWRSNEVYVESGNLGFEKEEIAENIFRNAEMFGYTCVGRYDNDELLNVWLFRPRMICRRPIPVLGYILQKKSGVFRISDETIRFYSPLSECNISLGYVIEEVMGAYGHVEKEIKNEIDVVERDL
jgi:hypothetical protein